jgi:hypothetical protein
MIDRSRIILVPIDNRPITYAFPQLIAHLAGIEAIVPPAEIIGSSKAPPNIEALSEWLDRTLKEMQPASLVICLDSLIYGGLVASRCCSDPLEVLLKRTKNILGWKQLTSTELKVLAQSSIMRISDNYYNNEEKPYWSEYGREIFRWSEFLHKQKRGLLKEESQLVQLKELESKIPSRVRQDYLDTRERNFQVHLNLIEYVQSGNIDFLILSQDDTGKYGLNVFEKEELILRCNQQKIDNVAAYVGTDEVSMVLLCRGLVLNSPTKPKCAVRFNLEQGKSVLSNYEGQSIEESLKAQMRTIAIETVSPSNANSSAENFAIIVHAAKDIQGDHVWLSGHPDRRTLDTSEEVEKTMSLLETATTPCVICDVAYSNGADPLLIEQLMRRKDLVGKLWGYAGWNTTGNTIGTALALGVARWYAKGEQRSGRRSADTDVSTDAAFKQAMFTRFADDWAYQTQVRPELSEPSDEKLNQLMKSYLSQIADMLDFKPKNVQLRLPWQRTFEVEIKLHD